MGASFCKHRNRVDSFNDGGGQAAMNSLSVPSPGGLAAKAPVGRSEYGRVKVALPRGKGLLDWIQLSSGKTLARRLPSVDHEELMKHNRLDDCWILLFGQVYDVTPYLEYHPGGVPELMRAAGTDASELFNKYHSWVNYDSMLKACIVGRFDGETSKLPPPGPSTLDVDDAANKETSSLSSSSRRKISESEEMTALSHSTLDAHNIRMTSPSPHSVHLSCPSWSPLSLRSECVSHSMRGDEMRILIRTMDGRPPMELVSDALPASSFPSLSVVESSIHLAFSELADPPTVGAEYCISRWRAKEKPGLSFHEARVVRLHRHSPIADSTLSSIRPPRSCIILIVELMDNCTLRVPVGHHVEIRVRKGGSMISRQYTPIPLTEPLAASIEGHDGMTSSSTSESSESGRLLAFLIKIYDDGIVTPVIGKLSEGDRVDISDPLGHLDFCLTPPPLFPPSPMNERAREVVCMAAGTGLTPMLGVLKERSNERCRLVLYNRTEEDIPSGIWLPYAEETNESSCPHSIIHILSTPSASWTGLSGRISRDRMGGDLKGNEVVFVCGPDGFVQEAARLLTECGHPSDLVHIFQG